MSDRLSEIEEYIKELPLTGETLHDLLGMARVLREFVAIVRMGQGLIWLIGAVGNADSLDKIGPDRAKLELLLGQLSDDAKEFLKVEGK